ncbi:MAG: hypothetical protein U0P45_13855 [Acidimicrobiales bacterium]
MPPSPHAHLEPTSEPADDQPGLDRRQLLARMAVGGAIAWGAPLIAKTAQAASATSCVNYTLDWSTLGSPGTTFTSTTVGGTTITLDASTYFGGTTGINNDHKIIAAPIGGMNVQGIQFEQTPKSGGGQNISFSFSQAVYNVSFTITDIDTLNGNWSDRITVVSPTNYTSSFPSGTLLTGTGAIGTANPPTNAVPGDPFRNTDTNNNLPNSSNQGNVTLTFPGPLTQFKLIFWCSTIAGGQNQLIKISPIAFCG